MYYYKGQTGFTLVELSIVLVIIGLIVGGVVGGQSLIKAAKIQQIQKELNMVRAAMHAYELQYDAIPGDHVEAQSYFGATDCPDGSGGGFCNGDGDGKMEYSSGFEDSRQMQHMKLAGLLEANIVASTTSGMFVSDFNEDSSILVPYSSSKGAHFISFGRHSMNGSLGASITPLDAITVDKKFDDGNYTTGAIRVQRRTGTGVQVEEYCYWDGAMLLSDPYTSCRLEADL